MPIPLRSTEHDDHRELLARAYGVAHNSPDPSTQNGAIVGTPERYSIGWNAPVGETLATIGLTDRGLKMLVTEHAERAALYGAARLGVPLQGATMVCPWSACAECARGIVEAGVVRLIRHANVHKEMPERWRESVALGDLILSMGGVEVVDVYTSEPLGVSVRFDGREVQR